MTSQFSLVGRVAVVTGGGRGIGRAIAAQRRLLDPSELTGMALLLALENGRGITGQALGVDGGYRL